MTQKCIWMLIITILFASINITSCTFSEYSMYTLNKDDIRFDMGGVILEHPLFTFEYPKCFGLVDINKFPDIVYNTNVTHIQFHRDLEGIAGPYESINIWIHKPGTWLWEDANAKEAIDNKIVSDRNNPYHQDFQIHERETLNIAEIPAEYVMYSYYRPEKEGRGYSPYSRTVRFVAFDYNNLIWKFQMDCFVESTEETEPYFQHIIVTFQFLN